MEAAQTSLRDRRAQLIRLKPAAPRCLTEKETNI